MRELRTLVLVAGLFATVACDARASGAPATTTVATVSADPKADVRQVTIPIEGMSCGACAARLKKALLETDGVVEAEVSLEHSNARIRYSAPRTSPDKLVSVIKGLGFTPGTPSASS